MSVVRLAILAFAATSFIACSDGASGPIDSEPEDVVIESTPPTAPTVPATDPGEPTLALVTGAFVPNAEGYFESEVTVRVLNWPDPVVGEKVTFELVKGSGRLSAAEVLTDAEGFARTMITFGLADEQVIQARTATSALAETRLLAYCAAAPAQRTLPCPPVD